MKKVIFGYIGGSYICAMQNVKLTKLNNDSVPKVKLTCVFASKFSVSPYMNPIKQGNSIKYEFEILDELYFTTKTNDNKLIYYLNGNELFKCANAPDKCEIEYENMKETTDEYEIGG